MSCGGVQLGLFCSSLIDLFELVAVPLPQPSAETAGVSYPVTFPALPTSSSRLPGAPFAETRGNNPLSEWHPCF